MECNKQVGYADADNCYREIEELKAENEKLKIENRRMYKQLEEIVNRYELAEAEERPFVLLPHLAQL